MLVCEKMNVTSEFYFAMVMDRAYMVSVLYFILIRLWPLVLPWLQGPVMVASPFGGVNIEEIARDSPSQIFKDPVDITSGTQC